MINDADLSIMSKAHTLANNVIATHKNKLAMDNHQSVNSFMDYRPKSLTESYQHGQSVARILADWKAEPALQAAGLLHSFVYRGVLSVEHIAQHCGDRTAFLCQQYRNILQQSLEAHHHGKPLVVKRVKLFVAAYCDPAIAFLGVASLWEHFIIARQSEPLQRPFAEEAEEVLIPLLDLLGMWALKSDVGEWVMQWGKNRHDYQRLVRRLIQTEDQRQRVFKRVEIELQPKLTTAHLICKFPTPVDIYNPHFPEKAHPEAFQRLTVDLLVDTEADCYTALRWIHRLWQPVENSVIDYIGMSKLNGDRYLQTTVVVPLGTNQIRTQFMIRTHEIEQINQWGLAAILMGDRHQVNLPKVWWNNREEAYAKICSASMGDLSEPLYVFSPQGQLFRFHRGCTVVDYAYQVHSELAHQCKRFRINGEVVTPTTVLRHLDLVELEQDPKFPGPTRAWLSAAHTERARSNIDRFLKRQSQSHLQGRVLFERQHQALAAHYSIDIPDYRLEQALHQTAKYHNLGSIETLLAEVAVGRVAPDSILHPLFSKEVARQVELPAGLRLLPHQLNLAQCCKPRPGDDIVGRPRYRGEQVVQLKIHQATCRRIATLQNNLVLKWRLQPQLNLVTRLEMTALAEDSLLFDALQVFQNSLPHITLRKVDALSRNGISRLNLTVEATDQALIDQVTQSLKNLPGHQINQVRQMQLLYSEREELAKPATPARYNPYRRQPVHDRDMFFGRSEELTTVYDMLRDDVGVIFVQGHKRVGKTSLLLHLKKYYFKHRSIAPVFVDFQMLSRLQAPNFHFEIAGMVYNDLQNSYQISNLEPPLKELFETEPIKQLTEYLQRVQSQYRVGKVVLLIDEFSRTIDAYQQGRIDDTLFQQWRGMIQTTVPQVSYVMVVQQQTYNHLHGKSAVPIWPLLELGETMPLKPLGEKDARQLIERPTHNYLDYSPNALRYVWRLTGGRPFLIQAFCFNLVRHMAYRNRRQVEWRDVHHVHAEFMHPDESLFAHLLDVIQSIPHGMAICRQLAQSLEKPTEQAELAQALDGIPPETLNVSLQKLSQQHILRAVDAGQWEFASLLFGRWLAVNLGQVTYDGD